MLMQSDTPRSPADYRRHPRRIRIPSLTILRRLLAAILAAVMLTLAVSYGRALTYPGEAPLDVRTVDWIRENGGAPLVNAVENWWYTRQAPPTSAPDPTLGSAGPVPAAPGTPAPLPAIGPRAAPGEGTWVAGPSSKNGTPPLLATFVRPDPVHPGVVAGVARFDQNLVKAQLIAGTREPDKRQWPEGGQVPLDQRGSLVATFNSGFKLAEARGGFYADSRGAQPLRDGAASLVIDRAGRVSVGAWGRDVRMSPDVAAVRQNLALIVDNGAPVPGLDVNSDNRWGSAKNQLQYTWRSALGVDARGNLFYVGGNQLTLASLARALADTGAVRGMELDIHPRMVHLYAYQHVNGQPQPLANPLLPTMQGPLDRYLQPDQRDFVSVTLR